MPITRVEGIKRNDKQSDILTPCHMALLVCDFVSHNSWGIISNRDTSKNV